MKKYLLYIVIFLIGAFAGMWAHRQYHFRDKVEMVVDTLVVVDTHIIERPVMMKKYIKETLYVEVRDTTIIRDSVYIALPMETKVYNGKEYYAEVSGYKPSLDLIKVYPKTETIYQTKTFVPKERKHSLSLYGGVGYMGEARLPVGLEYQYHARNWISFGGKVEHDFALNATGVYGTTKMTISW